MALWETVDWVEDCLLGCFHECLLNIISLLLIRLFSLLVVLCSGAFRGISIVDIQRDWTAFLSSSFVFCFAV